jgi:phosphoglycolate phosphatase
VSFPFAIFDIDGTLVDSRAMITTCMDKAFVGVGLPAPGYEKTRRIIGLSLGVGLRALAPEGDDALHARILESYREAFFAMRKDPTLASPLYEGVTDLLDHLTATGWKLGIATGKSRRGLDDMIERFGWRHRFVSHFCADDGAGKPDPHMVLANLEAARASPARSIVIGDSEHDIAMAVNARVASIGVTTWGFGTREEMQAAGGTAIVETIEALSDMLDAFANGQTI